MIKNFVTKHRILSVIVLCALIVILSTIYYAIIGPHPVTQVQEPVSHTTNSANTTITIVPTYPKVATQTYTNPTYHISFPQTWTEDTNTTADSQGKMLLIQPEQKNASENAHVAVEINNTQETTLANMSKGLTFLGLHKSYDTVDGISAQKFTGVVNFSGKILHNTIYLFQFDNQIYLIKLSYQGSDTDEQLEQEFIQTVNTMRFN